MNILPLVEKFRPKEFNEVVGVKELDNLKNVTNIPMEMPNLLLFGPQGTGKTTVAKIIIEKLKPVDILRLNGSDKRDRNIETMSGRVMDFGMSKSSMKDKPKIIFIDEVDNLTPDAFQSLRGNIEKVIKNARFICTANYLEKIPGPIQSRFSTFKFEKADTTEIIPRLTHIINTEGITVEGDMLEKIAKAFRGDIRGTINAIQLLSSHNKTITAGQLLELNTLLEEVYTLLLQKKWSKIRYDIPQKNPDYNQLLVDLDDKFFNSELPVIKKAEINDIIARGQFEMSLSFDHNICFSAICSRIINII